MYLSAKYKERILTRSLFAPERRKGGALNSIRSRRALLVLKLIAKISAISRE